jgi:feruloyl esterase
MVVGVEFRCSRLKAGHQIRTGGSVKHDLVTALIIASTLAAAAIDGELTATAAQSCESLASLRLPNATITLAQAVGPGAFTPPAPAGGAAVSRAAAKAFSDLPAFCRVAATLRPSSDSDH